MSGDFSGKIVVITGASTGLGRAIAVETAKKLATRPLWVKLSPWVGFIGLTAKTAEEAREF